MLFSGHVNGKNMIYNLMFISNKILLFILWKKIFYSPVFTGWIEMWGRLLIHFYVEKAHRIKSSEVHYITVKGQTK